MKKLIALLMVCGFAMSFVACGGGSEKAEDSEEATEAPAMEPAPNETDTTTVDTTDVQ
jgi:hypothetical protein